MSLLNLFGLTSQNSPEEKAAGETETVRAIVKKISALDSTQARYLAAFAYILGRAANADREISPAEIEKMIALLTQMGHLSQDQARLVVDLVIHQTTLFGSTEDYLVTREFKSISTPKQREELLDCLFAIAAADDSISAIEENRIRQISSELGFTHKAFVQARLAYSEKREVMKLAKASRP